MSTCPYTTYLKPTFKALALDLFLALVQNLERRMFPLPPSEGVYDGRAKREEKGGGKEGNSRWRHLAIAKYQMRAKYIKNLLITVG